MDKNKKEIIKGDVKKVSLVDYPATGIEFMLYKQKNAIENKQSEDIMSDQVSAQTNPELDLLKSEIEQLRKSQQEAEMLRKKYEEQVDSNKELAVELEKFKDKLAAERNELKKREYLARFEKSELPVDKEKLAKLAQLIDETTQLTKSQDGEAFDYSEVLSQVISAAESAISSANLTKAVGTSRVPVGGAIEKAVALAKQYAESHNVNESSALLSIFENDPSLYEMYTKEKQQNMKG